MKRIHVLLFTVALSAFLFSCEEKSNSEKLQDKMENTGDDIKDKAKDVGQDIKEESKKTTKNGSDAH